MDAPLLQNPLVASPVTIPPLLPKREGEIPLTAKVVFYCKDCRKLVDTTRVGKKYVYTCNLCKTKNVAFGTAKSIGSFFHIKEGV